MLAARYPLPTVAAIEDALDVSRRVNRTAHMTIAVARKCNASV
jgi:hypothetical protein